LDVDPTATRTSKRAFATLFKSRYMVLLAVISLYVLSAAMFVYATVRVGVSLFSLVSSFSTDAAKGLMLFAVETADLFLIAVVLYVTAAGLYTLFMGRREVEQQASAAKWLEVETLDDLKQNLIGIVVVALAVLFLGVVIRDDSEGNLLETGVGIGALVAALGWYVSQRSRAKESDAKASETKSNSA
jgi:uncharacterized membrane protein YqhA